VAAPEMLTRRNAMKYGSLLVFLLGTLGSEVLGKRVAIAVPQFPSALTVLTGFVGAIAYMLTVSAALYSQLVQRQDVVMRPLMPAVVAALFALHNVLFNVGNRGAAVPGAIVLVLTKFKVPLTMLISIPRRTMGYDYSWTHWGGAVILMLGIFLTVCGGLMHHEIATNAIGQMALIVLSDFPLALSFVLIEKYLKEINAQLFTTALWMWVCLLQAPISLGIVLVLGLLSGEGSSTVHNLIDGVRCCTLGMASANDPDAKCSEAQRFYLLSLFPGLALNFAMPMCTRYGSAGLLWVVRSVAVPAGAILFSRPWVMGSHATPFSPCQVLGLVIVVTGVVLFNLHDPVIRMTGLISNRADGGSSVLG